MKVAIVHDYIKEYGGAERVLEALSEIFPNAPIYTAFYEECSTAHEHFKKKKIITSWAQHFPFFSSKLSSPLRFLTPLIWRSFDLSEYDLVISSASWYITKGFKKTGDHFIEICYCHTPPRWLYGYSTSINFQKYAIVRLYALIVGHFMRIYDHKQAQKVDYFIANSREVAGRIKKFYRRDSKVIYPPVSLPKVSDVKPFGKAQDKKEDYYFIVSRIVGGKGLNIAVEAAIKAGFKLKIAGSPAGYYFEHKNLIKKSNAEGPKRSRRIEFLGQVTDGELAKLYKEAKAFLALAKDEDFGITPVEAMLSGTPVIAFNGGGYKETVIDGKTGVFFNESTTESLIGAIKKFEKMNIKSEDCIKQAQKFSKERFKKEIKAFVESKIK